MYTYVRSFNVYTYIRMFVSGRRDGTGRASRESRSSFTQDVHVRQETSMSQGQTSYQKYVGTHYVLFQYQTVALRRRHTRLGRREERFGGSTQVFVYTHPYVWVTTLDIRFARTRTPRVGHLNSLSRRNFKILIGTNTLLTQGPFNC